MFSRGSIGRSAIAILPIAAGNYVEEPTTTATGIGALHARATRRRTGKASCSASTTVTAIGTRRMAIAAIAASVGISAAIGTRRCPASSVSSAALNLTAVAIRRSTGAARATGVSQLTAALRYRFLHWAAEASTFTVQPESRRFEVPEENRLFEVGHRPELLVPQSKRDFH